MLRFAKAMSSAKVTVPALRARKNGPKISMVTAYDATMAKLLEAGGADVLLVGDSLGMVVQGQSNTLPVTLDEMCYHGRAVARAATRAHVMGDLPFMSYQASPEQAVSAAGKLLKEGGCESVKLEGGRDFAEHVRRIVSCGIPVMAHIGLTPQSVHAMGGFRVQGRSAEAAERLLEDARVLEAAGAFALLLEGIPAELGARITAAVGIPTVGIGAGPHCDGQVLVCYDFLGMYPDLRPRFVKRFAEVGETIVEATRAYVAEVQAGTFPTEAHSFGGSAKPELTGNRPLVVGSKQGYGPANGE
jgi:3-methyl-2-oxobutanoate hydroxymethyltransferase